MTKELSITEVSGISKKTIPSWVLRTYESMLDSSGDKKTSLKFEIDATHSGRVTNGRIYPGKKMRAAASSWYSQDNGGSSQYDKPVLKHHDEHADPIGRVKKAKFIALKHNEDFNLDYKNPDEKGSGSGFIRLTVDILDPESIEKILDGRLETVSSRQTTDKFYCNICDKEKDFFYSFFGGEDEDEEAVCKHKMGEVYEVKTEDGKKQKKTARMYTGDLLYHEVSFVTVPGDAYAKVVRSSIMADNKEVKNQSALQQISQFSAIENESEIMLHDFRILDATGTPIKAVEKKIIEIVSKPVKKAKEEVLVVDAGISMPAPADSVKETIVETQKIGPESKENTQFNNSAQLEQNNNRRTDTMADTSESVSFNPDEAKKLLDNQIKLTDTLQKDLDAKDKKIAELEKQL